MKDTKKSKIVTDIFSGISDWRSSIGKKHELIDILFIGLCSMIGGAESFTDMADFGLAREAWLRQHISLPHGVPSHDTFRRVFMALKPKGFLDCFTRLTCKLSDLSQGELIAIDGKKLRGIKEGEHADNCHAFYLVNAWAVENGICLAQQKVLDKSNEITALPKILSMLDLEGKVVSVDAMGAQRGVASQIIEANGDYIMSLKGNQGSLHDQVKELFEVESVNGYHFLELTKDDQWDKGHGRAERRQCYVCYNPELLPAADKWAGIGALVRLDAQRVDKKGKLQEETRYYITSLKSSAKSINQYIRGHWAVENSLHWVLDVVFKEDGCRTSKDNAPENLSLLRKMALNLIKQHKGKKSIKRTRYEATMSIDTLDKIVFGKFYA